jgi:hypothetical protein
MQYITYIPNEKKMIFRDVEYQFQGYETIDNNSLFIILGEQFIKFYWNDTTINNKTFTSMKDFTYFLDSII